MFSLAGLDRRDRLILCATGLLAVGVPVGAAAWVGARTADLADRLTAAGGVPARIGSVDADLTGAIRLTDVALGELVAVDALEASVAMGSLLSGELRADELRVEAPRVAIRVDADGDSDLARLARRLVQRSSGGSSSGERRLRRIVVAEGTLTASIAGLGELVADEVELVPHATGVRVITGPVRVHAADRIDVSFSRSAAELSLRDMRFGRLLAVGGAGVVTAGRGTIVLRDVAAGRLAAGGALEIRAFVDDGGVPRSLAVDVAPSDLAVTLRGDKLPLGPLASFAPSSIRLAGARASGSLTIRRRGSIEVSADGSIDGLVIDHAAIAPGPIELSAAARAEVTISSDAIAVTRAGLEVGAVRLSASGWIRRGAPISGQLDLQLAPTACADLLAALPTDLRGPLDGLGLEGTLGARARLSLDLAAPDGEGASVTNRLTGECRVTSEPPAADVNMLAQVSEQQLADGSRRRIGSGEPGYTRLKNLPHHVSGAFVSAEDGRFFEHHGFDLEQIARSLEIDLRERRLARGGSTISQQLVKNAFLSRRRTLDRKIQEAVLTWRLEDRLDKKQILERYLNIIELGPRVFGLAAAARHWFDVSPRDLTVRQAAFLAALTSQPTSMSRRVRRAGGLDATSAERLGVVLRAMKRDGVIDSEAYDKAKTASLRFSSTAVPPER